MNSNTIPEKETKDVVLITKTALMNSMGEKFQKYLNHMKSWFCQKWTKSEFDIECRKILTPEQMSLHNDFFVAILNKIDAVATPKLSKKRKINHRSEPLRAVFQPADIMDYIPKENLQDVVPPNGTSSPVQRYVVQELFLPEPGLIMGRLLVGAWEIGLVNADDMAVDMIVTGVQVLLKNIITAIILKKKHYRVTANGNYFYDVGHQMKDPFLRNTISRQKVTDERIDIDREILLRKEQKKFEGKPGEETIFLADCEEIQPVQQRRITALDVYNTLMDKNIIPAHSVYSLNIERISNMLS